jgi:hypothetical protein
MDGWILRPSPGLATFAGGASMVFHPSAGPRGTLAAGNSTTKVVLSTALPSAVAINQLANNGSGARGFRIRIIGNAGGSSGKIEERYVVANSAGTTPTLTLDSALSFTPATGDGYEILSGRLFIYGSGTTAGTFKYYDVATNSFSGNLAVPGTGSGSTVARMVSLSELHVPYTRAPSEGFFGNLVATSSAAGTLTGQAAAGDAAVLSNQYRNFQVRIVQDTAIPTAAGQRRRITSHTAGASPVYTLASNWSVTPSTTATYVIENDDDKIILIHDGSTSTFNYNITAATWDSTTWASNSAAGGGAYMAQSFGIALGTDLAVDLSRHSHIFLFRNAATLDVFDIAGASTGSWSAAAVYGNAPATLVSTGTGGAYDPVTQQGRYMYLTQIHSNLQLAARFDCKNRVLEQLPGLKYPQSTAVAGNKNAMSFFVDGATKLSFHNCLYNTSPVFMSMACQR